MSAEQQQFDQRTSRRLLRSYLTPDIVAQRRATRAAIAAVPGERVLDVGCGPGLLAGELAAEVAPGGTVDGVDPSADMLTLARERFPELRFRPGEATALPFADGAFDILVSTQVYEYVADVAAALAEARRVLAPGGRLAILDTDWDSLVWRTRDPALHARVIDAWDEHLADPYLPRRLPQLLSAAGFTEVAGQVIPLLSVGDRPDTFCAGLRHLIAGYVPGHRGVTEADAAAWLADVSSLGEAAFFSLNRYLFVAR